MNLNVNKIGLAAVSGVLMLVAGSCNDINRQEAPVLLVVSNTQELHRLEIDRYQVSYVRTDGGHLVPAPFVRSISTVIAAGAAAEGTNFQAFDPGAVNQAPFAALLPQNGGRDPETGKPFVVMDVILTVFGQTLAGERVSGNTRLSLEFCFSCGGCA